MDDASDGMTGLAAGTAAPHPEEMRASAELRLGRAVSLSASARATPAGLVAVGLLLSAVMIPLAWVAVARVGGRQAGSPASLAPGRNTASWNRL